MNLHAALRVEMPGLDLDAVLDVPAGSVTALIGANGAGKTTLLRCVAGLRAIDAGRIQLGGRALDEPPSAWVPPEHRRIGSVHQDHLLFPHLTALDNVAFGPRSQGRSQREARAVARGWLERLGLAGHESSRPAELSGGQSQRVALARALAAAPDALLLDEPLSALDATTRVGVRRDLRRHLADFAGPAVVVTHDPIDVFSLADRVVVLAHGSVAQAGTVAEVVARPRTAFVADLVGTNLLRGRSAGTTVSLASGARITAADEHHGDAFVTIAPSAVTLHRTEPDSSARNRWEATVVHLDDAGSRVRVRLAGPVDLTTEVTPAAVADLALGEGTRVWATVKATEVAVYPA